MAKDTEGFEVGFNEAMNDWYIVHRHMQGNVLHRNILVEHYESKEAANEAAAQMGARPDDL